MSKAIAIIIILVAVGAGAYWLSQGKLGAPTATTTPSTTQTSAGTQPAAPASASSVSAPTTTKGPFMLGKDATGPYLAGLDGLTLYVNIADENSSGKIKPSCDATCEKTWIPYLLPDNTTAPDKSTDPILSHVNLFKRSDGKFQYALGTKPIYRYSGDTKPGQITGVTGNWVVARP